jgi:hypothetical protein
MQSCEGKTADILKRADRARVGRNRVVADAA